MDNIVIFDGVCGLCNQSVNILIKLDKHQILKYTPLQGKFVRTLDVTPEIDSIIYYKKGKLYYKSTAILRILISLGGMWLLTYIFYIIPEFIRDFMYDIVSKYRYRLFGKMTSCRVPNEREQHLFIK
jgi:predicted DCC family thiol-disulfide oxidoreductase YuxK